MIPGLAIPILVALALPQHNARADDAASAVPILVYHRIAPAGGDPASDVIPLDRFERHMRHLADRGYTTLTTEQLVGFMRGGDVPTRSVVLQFDDGWSSQLAAIPILKELGFRASFWIFPEGRQPGTYMSWEQIREIAADPDFEVQSHSLTHPWDRASNLVTWVDGATPGRSRTDAEFELVESKRQLESQLETPVRYLAWPMGWYNQELIDLARAAGYEALFTIEAGENLPGGDVLRIRRIAIDGSCGLADLDEILAHHRYPACGGKPAPRIPNTPYPS